MSFFGCILNNLSPYKKKTTINFVTLQFSRSMRLIGLSVTEATKPIFIKKFGFESRVMSKLLPIFPFLELPQLRRQKSKKEVANRVLTQQ